jgi:hypothetical protein
MTPASEFRSLRAALFGEYGGQLRCTRFLKRPDGTHVNVRTVRRWEQGQSPIPVGVMELLRAELERRAE